MTTTNLPKGIDQETYDTAKNIILSGFKAGQDENAIKSAMFGEGIKFSDLVRLYKAITIGEGLIRSPKEIKADIEEKVEGTEIIESLEDRETDLTYDELEDDIKRITSEVEGATEKKVIAAFRNALAEHDFDMPKKPKKSKGQKAGKINTAICAAFAKNPELTAKEFETMISAVTTEKSVKKWCRMYKLFSALAMGKELA